jgi:UDP-N-acetylmuramoylalanine--D-glutamate ligase
MRGDFSVEGQRVVVVGAARSGLAAAELLVRRGARVTLTDIRDTVQNQERLRSLGVRTELGGHRAETLDGANLLVMSPGVPIDLPEVAAARAKGVRVVGELELASRWLKGRMVAITGTKGKSTTTTLVGRMLRAAGHTVLVGGNIGVPLSAQVDDSTQDTVHVIEASSFQLEATDTFHPWIAALLNFSPDHLDRHPSEAAYGAAKARIFANQTEHDWLVVNADNPPALALAAAARARRVTYAVDGATGTFFADDRFIWKQTSDGAIPLVPVSAIQLAGHHMLSNVTAASAVSHLAGADGGAIARALDGFTGLEHVMEPVAAIGGVRFVNDSKATNIDAAGRSIESFDAVVAIVGGRYKGGEFRDLAGPLRAHGRGVVAIGEARALVRDALSAIVPVIEAATMREAVKEAYAMAEPNGVVLLAPACSSFDMFVDYADRGRVFKAEVDRLVNDQRAQQSIGIDRDA